MTTKPADDRPVLIRRGDGLYPYTCRIGTFEASEVRLMPRSTIGGRSVQVLVHRTHGGSGLWDVRLTLDHHGRGNVLTVHTAAGRALSPLRYTDLYAAVTFTAIRAAERANRAEPT